MAIFRFPHKAEFTQISNETLRDMSIPDRARGMLCRMLSFPLGFRIEPMKHLVNQWASRNTIYADLKLLRKAGYSAMVYSSKPGLNKCFKDHMVFERKVTREQAEALLMEAVEAGLLPFFVGKKIRILIGDEEGDILQNAQNDYAQNDDAQSDNDDSGYVDHDDDDVSEMAPVMAPVADQTIAYSDPPKEQPKPKPKPVESPIKGPSKAAKIENGQVKTFLDFSNPDTRRQPRATGWQAELNQKLEPKLRGELATKVAALHGLTAMLDSSDEGTLEQCSRIAVILHGMGYKTVKSLDAIEIGWKEHWRGQRGQLPIIKHSIAQSDIVVLASQLKETPSQGQGGEESDIPGYKWGTATGPQQPGYIARDKSYRGPFYMPKAARNQIIDYASAEFDYGSD